ncbi:MAG: hypothetical protein MJZ34_02425 [Paludibacteraceae bacterium]|nr:hypothetical protein [Paludibacteraceae bacterium]
MKSVQFEGLQLHHAALEERKCGNQVDLAFVSYPKDPEADPCVITISGLLMDEGFKYKTGHTYTICFDNTADDFTVMCVDAMYDENNNLRYGVILRKDNCTATKSYTEVTFQTDQIVNLGDHFSMTVVDVSDQVATINGCFCKVANC